VTTEFHQVGDEVQMGWLTGIILAVGVCLALASAPASVARPKWMPAAPPLEGKGRIVNVSSVGELERALREAGDGDTIMVADGTYQLSRFLQLEGRRNVTLRGAAGDRRRVVLRGLGWDSNTNQDDILRIQGCTGVTVAHMTFTDCHAYGIKLEQLAREGRRLEDINIYDCDFVNIGTRGVKGTGGGGGYVDGGSIRYCNFENAQVPRRSWLFDGDYISAIDCMRLKDWVISDNYFKNIKGANGGGRGAIFVWVESENVITERNVVVNCDRSICYGNPSGSTESPARPHNRGGIIRNNFILGGVGTAIEVSWARGVKVYHNTVLTPDPDHGRGIHYHWQEISDVEVMHNIVRGRVYGDEGGVTKANNITSGVADAWFRNLGEGDLHLTPAAEPAIGKVEQLAECPGDFDGETRRAEGTDIGADQYAGGAPGCASRGCGT
jgi:hypothetical protein